ncbi:GNAT family N-acetyltransferase [Prauserella flavalba]|uniref:GNAT family N-acetyltransferase n=1 Tax=Prauserella flavalba TaxID=1477506 RepID=UPI0036EAD1BF
MMIDESASIGVLVAAFQDDPVSCWLFPEDESRPRAAERLFAPLVARSAADGELVVTGDGAAVAVWVPLSAGESVMGHSDDELPPELLPHARRLVTFAELAAQRHPHDRAHLYLPFLGVEPGRRGSGLGGALLAERLARADRQGLPAYLEASSARSRPLYERHGFHVTGDPITLPDGPEVWPMWREPAQRQGELR